MKNVMVEIETKPKGRWVKDSIRCHPQNTGELDWEHRSENPVRHHAERQKGKK